MRTGNPVLKADTFTREPAVAGGEVMTLQGAVAKTALAVLVTIASASFVWMHIQSAGAHLAATTIAGVPALALIVGSVITGAILGFVTAFFPKLAPWTTIPYAVAQGVALATISASYEHRYPGIVMNAVGLTFGTLAALLAAYTTGLIRATENFKLGVVAATGGICLVYLVNFGLNMFAHTSLSFIHDSGPLGILFSLFVVGIAALNLVLDFDFIEKGAEQRAPKYMEWYAAFGLLVTLIWLYLEILRLLAKLQDRRGGGSTRS